MMLAKDHIISFNKIFQQIKKYTPLRKLTFLLLEALHLISHCFCYIIKICSTQNEKKKKKSKNVRKSTASLHRILNIEYDILLITNAVLLDIEVHTHLFMG